jgi:myo-inositol-1-phosphate synthase
MTGMVTNCMPCGALDLVPPDSLIFGCHDIQTGRVVAAAKRLIERNEVPDGETIDAVRNK